MPELLVSPLTPEEMAAFNEAFASMQDDILLADRALVREKILLTIQAAKAKLNASFTGAYPGGGELGIGRLRPEHWSGSRTWGTYYFASATWLNWIYNNNTSLKDHFSCVWELEERMINTTRAPVEASIQIGPVTLPVIDLRPLRIGAYNRVPLPVPMVISDNQVIQLSLNFDFVAGAREEIRPVGVVVTTGANLVKKRPT
jgi:hypothetical protein